MTNKTIYGGYLFRRAKLLNIARRALRRIKPKPEGSLRLLKFDPHKRISNVSNVTESIQLEQNQSYNKRYNKTISSFRDFRRQTLSLRCNVFEISQISNNFGADKFYMTRKINGRYIQEVHVPHIAATHFSTFNLRLNSNAE